MGMPLEGAEAHAHESVELSDVDLLLAEAEAEAQASQRIVNTGGINSAKDGKKKSLEMAERAEELERTIAGYAATDAGVEDFHYEEIFRYAETVTGVAVPKKITLLLENLRKAGDGLRKLSGIEVKSAALLVKLDQIQELHDRYFAEVQGLVMETLDRLKKRFKGEADEFEQRFKLLTDSPLVRGIEYDQDSPERRVEGLRHEIAELFLRPLVDNRLKVMEKRVVEAPKELEALEQAYRTFTQNYPQVKGREPSVYNLQNFLNDHKIGGGPEGFYRKVEDRIQKLRGEVAMKDKPLLRDKLALEVNRSVIEMALGDANDETELTQAVKELRVYFNAARGWIERHQGAGVPWSLKDDQYGYLPLPKDALAQKVLGAYELFATPLPGEYGGDTLTGSLSTGEQLLGRSMEVYREHARSGSLPLADYLGRQGKRAFLQTTGFQGTNEEIGSRVARTHDERYNQIVPVHEGSGKFWNLRRASTRVDQGYKGRKDELEPLPKDLVDAGWTISKLGAFVEPGQDVRVIDREYALTLDRLAKPQIEAERAFDVRSPDGVFHVYTTDQAVDLLRRARRDAREILEETERAVMGEQGKVQARDQELGQTRAQLEARGRETESLAEKIRRREEELKAAHAEALHAKDTKFVEMRQGWERALEQAQSMARQKDIDLHEAASSERGSRKEAKDTLDGIRKDLQTALTSKPGLLGGEKELRAAVEKLLQRL